MEDPIDHDEVGDGSGPFHGVWTVPARTDDAPDLRALEKALVTRDVSGVVAALVDVLPGYHPSPVLSERVSAGGNPV